jgi:hypothetical protein
MDVKGVLTGTVVGGIVMYVMGYLLWGVLLTSFFEGQTAGAVGRDAPVLWAAVVGTLSLAMLVTLVVGWSDSASMMEGFRTGALVGFLVWFVVDLIIFANFEFSTLAGSVSDALVESVRTGIGGAAIGAVLGMGSNSQPAAPAL